MKVFLFLFLAVFLHAQKLIPLNNEQDSVSFRGISVVNENTFWVSGSKGTIGKTTNQGKSFEWFHPKGYETMEFRDIHAFNENEAIILGITEPAAILETQNGGKTWKEIYKDTQKGAFLDAFDCTPEVCFAVGDAVIPNELYLLKYENGKWKKTKNAFKTQEGEAFFAASGTNIKILSDKEFIAVSGGKTSRLIYTYNGFEKIQEIPILQGKETTGANGLDFLPSEKKGIIAGGDFMNPQESMFNMVLFSWNENTHEFDFDFPLKPPFGYKSAVCYLDTKTAVSCGISGVDISYDGGVNWIHFSDLSFHSISKINIKTCILTGGKGEIFLLEL